MVEKDNKNVEDEVLFEEDAATLSDDIETEDSEISLNDKLKQLRVKLKTCEEEKQAHQDALQRTRADFLNSKRRLDEQFIRDKERATDKILMELLALVDSFDNAMADKKLWDSIDERWRGGVEAIHTKLLSILKNNDVEMDDPLGAPFNPEEHEAVSNLQTDDLAKVDTVLTVLQKGFKRNNVTIRPARVVVGTK